MGVFAWQGPAGGGGLSLPTGVEGQFLGYGPGGAPVAVSAPIGQQGPQGAQGPAGDAGPQGLQGIQGPQGDVGPQGPVGPVGADGTSITVTDFTDDAAFDAYTPAANEIVNLYAPEV